MFVGNVFHEDRNVHSICSTADYTFVNERLAKHYGIRGIFTGASSAACPSRLAMNAARLLGQGSILTVTSLSHAHLTCAARQVDSSKTSWERRRLRPLRTCPTLKESDEGGKGHDGSRTPGEEHRKNPTCVHVP